MRLRAESRSDSNDAARLVSSVTLSESAPMMSPDASRRCGSSDTRSPSLPGPTPRVRAKSVYERGKERQNSRITRPKVLLIVGHPSVGSALETLLRIDDRYEVRRVQSLADSAIDRNEWTPDVAVVDGALLGSTIVAALPLPAIVLSGNEADGTRPPARVDAPIPAAPKPRLIPTREDRDQGALIRKALIEETATPPVAIPSPRGAPGPGEIDLVATPLPTPDDWHRFELALRKIKGVGQLRTEYYRHGVLKVRVTYQGEGRLAAALRAGVPGYRVRVIGEDRATLQILVTSEGDDRRPG